jgi:hypothetical protein
VIFEAGPLGLELETGFGGACTAIKVGGSPAPPSSIE